MSFLAELSIESGEPISVLHCGFRFSQAIDATGKTIARPLGGQVNLVVESNGDTELFDWMINPTQTKNGTVTFYRRDASSKLKKLEFTNAHCVEYYETFDHQGQAPMQIQLTISAQKIKLNDSEYENNWPV